MTIDLNKLKGMGRDELITLALQVGAPHHHRNSPETLVESIINKVMERTVIRPEKDKDVSEMKLPAMDTIFLTEEELEKAFASIKARYGAFSTIYDDESKCVIMRYNDGRYRHSETMNLSCSLSKFVRKANEIAKGPLIVRTHKPEDWRNLGGSSVKNGYTETVIAG